MRSLEERQASRQAKLAVVKHSCSTQRAIAYDKVVMVDASIDTNRYGKYDQWK